MQHNCVRIFILVQDYNDSKQNKTKFDRQNDNIVKTLPDLAIRFNKSMVNVMYSLVNLSGDLYQVTAQIDILKSTVCS